MWQVLVAVAGGLLLLWLVLGAALWISQRKTVEELTLPEALRAVARPSLRLPFEVISSALVVGNPGPATEAALARLVPRAVKPPSLASLQPPA